MYLESAFADTPSDDTILWRYMDLPKLLALLRSGSLYLCRLDRLRDPWEGQWPRADLEAFLNDDSYWGPLVAGSKEAFVDAIKQMPKSFYVSCWHESAYESAGLWDQYGDSRGLAVRSTIGQLKRSMGDAKLTQYFIGRVRYIDYLKQEGEGLAMIEPAFLKRRSFEQEREVRVLRWSLTPDVGEPGEA